MTEQEIKAKALDFIDMFMMEADVRSFSADKMDDWAEYAKSLVFQICGVVDFVKYLVKHINEEDCNEENEEIEEKDLDKYVI